MSQACTLPILAHLIAPSFCSSLGGPRGHPREAHRADSGVCGAELHVSDEQAAQLLVEVVQLLRPESEHGRLQELMPDITGGRKSLSHGHGEPVLPALLHRREGVGIRTSG